MAVRQIRAVRRRDGRSARRGHRGAGEGQKDCEQEKESPHGRPDGRRRRVNTPSHNAPGRLIELLSALATIESRPDRAELDRKERTMTPGGSGLAEYGAC